MKKSIIILAALAGTLNMSAQKELWITGSAVPGGTQKLETFPDGQFKFAGTLNAGELKVITTDGEQAATQYLTPRSFESYVVNKGLAYAKTRSADDAAWIVPFTEDRYKFTVDTKTQTLTGELFVPWREVYIAGGACEIGWQAFVMLPFTQDAEDPTSSPGRENCASATRTWSRDASSCRDRTPGTPRACIPTRRTRPASPPRRCATKATTPSGRSTATESID